jgi:hypothetical protein
MQNMFQTNNYGGNINTKITEKVNNVSVLNAGDFGIMGSFGTNSSKLPLPEQQLSDLNLNNYHTMQNMFATSTPKTNLNTFATQNNNNFSLNSNPLIAPIAQPVNLDLNNELLFTKKPDNNVSIFLPN